MSSTHPPKSEKKIKMVEFRLQMRTRENNHKTSVALGSEVELVEGNLT